MFVLHPSIVVPYHAWLIFQKTMQGGYNDALRPGGILDVRGAIPLEWRHAPWDDKNGRSSVAVISPRTAAFLILLSAGAVVSQVYYTRVAKPNLTVRMERHAEIVSGTAVSPYRYRILVPFAAETLTDAFARVTSRETAFRLAYRILEPCGIVLALFCLYFWLTEWFSTDQALLGVLFVTTTVPIALQDHDYQPWSVPEVALFTGALIAIRHNRFWIVAAIVAVATLNRETAVFIPMAYLLMNIEVTLRADQTRQNRTSVLRAVGLFVIWAAIFIGLRVVRGDAPPLMPLSALFDWNRDPESLRRGVTNWTLFLGAFWIFAAFGFRTAPAPLRRLTLLLPLYLLTVFVWGVWFEVRLLMTLYPLLVPLALCALYRSSRS